MTVIDNREMLGAESSELSEAGARDYFELLKPRVMSLVVFTAFAGLVLAPGEINPILGIIAILCIAVGAGASGALNMWYDADIDAVMSRTARRPIPSGRITPREALAFGLTLSAFSVVILGLAINWFSAGLLAFTIFFYAAIYTMWLKRSTPQNIVIGGAAGAVPPLVGWVATTGSFDPAALYLFAIVFYWTPPHFWALSLRMKDEYAAVGVPMLPVVRGEDETRRQITLYTFLLVAVTFLPFAGQLFDGIYAVCAAILGGWFLWLAVRLQRNPSPASALKLYLFSMLYLALLFGAMVADVKL
jgi:protoheme IX farnesyltransferase